MVITDNFFFQSGYQYFITAAGMPNDCSYLRTRLQIEYSRLLDWSVVAGLADFKDGQDLPEILKANRLVLVAVLTEVRISMDQLADIYGKYVELQAGADPTEEVTDVQLFEKVSDLSLTPDKKVVDRKYLRGFNHLAHGSSMAKNIFKHPKRLQWVAFDSGVFTKMLTRLAELNDHLHEMMHDHQARALEAATQKTYLEMVQVRASVDELKHLVAAAVTLQERGPTTSPGVLKRLQSEQLLVSLANFKTLNTSNDRSVGDTLPTNHSATAPRQLKHSEFEYSSTALDDASENTRTRCEGRYRSDDGTVHQVWIEWKTYKYRYSRKARKVRPIRENVQRVQELVTLLQSDKPSEFCTPHCMGYFDDRDDCDESEHDYRFGLVFKKPGIAREPVSLYQLMVNHSKPSLDDRMLLAHKIAKCMLYLHAVNWLHKAFRSDSITFFPSKENINIAQPYLTGYEYARPDRDGETTASTGGDADRSWQLYVHPYYQNRSVKVTYRKTFDIYSLGIVLLEIAYWKNIADVVGFKPETARDDQRRGVRDQLLNSDDKYLNDLKENYGNTFCGAVRRCLEGRPAFDINEEENEMEVETGAKLQQMFSSKVVDALSSIRV